MGRPRGSEPPTSGTTNQRSNQLSYDRHSATKAGAFLKGCSGPASSLVWVFLFGKPNDGYTL